MKTLFLSFVLSPLCVCASFAQVTPALAPTAASQEPDRSKPVPPAPARPFQVPAVDEAPLPRGAKLALIQVRRFPIVAVSIIIPLGGSVFDPEGKAGLAGLVASLLKEGTVGLDSRRFAEAVDDLGAGIDVGLSEECMTVTLFALKDNVDRTMALAADMLLRPSLPARELDRIRQEALASLQQEKGDPGTLAGKRLTTLIFGKHPYGRQADEASVTSITRQDVVDFHANHIRPEGAVFTASGDLDKAELEALVRKHFGDWLKSDATALAAAPPVPPLPEGAGADASAQGMTIDVIDMPGSEQSAIRAGHLSIARGNPDYLPLKIMNHLLGGGAIISRLNQNLREAKHWAYGAGSSIDALIRGGSFAVSVDVQTDATAKALQEILRELNRLRDEAVSRDELEAAQLNMTGGFIRSQQKIEAINSQVAGIELYGLPKDSLSTYRDRVKAVSPEDIQRVARRHLRPESLHIVIAGDAEKIVPDLKSLRLAPVNVFDVDGRPKPSA